MRILLIEDNPGDAILTREALLEAPEEVEVRQATTLLEALDVLAEEQFDAVLLDLNLPDSAGLETFHALRQLAPGVPVVILTGQDSDATALAAVEAGAEDYLVKGEFQSEQLVRAIRYAIIRHRSRPQPEASPLRGRLFGVLGVKGGTGATTFACHLAAELAAQSKQKTLLVDADLDLGCAAFLFKCSPAHTLVDAANYVFQLEKEFWETLVAHVDENLDLLASPALAGAEPTATPARILHVLRFAQRHYDWAVVDLGRPSGGVSRLWSACRQVFLVTRGGYLEVHRAASLLEQLHRSGLPIPTLALVHCYGSRSDPGPRLLRRLVDLPAVCELPYCDRELQEAIAQGHLLESSSKYRRAVATLASELIAASSQQQEVRQTLASSLQALAKATGFRQPNFQIEEVNASRARRTP